MNHARTTHEKDLKSAGFQPFSQIAILDVQSGHGGLRELTTGLVAAHRASKDGTKFHTYRQVGTPSRVFVLVGHDSLAELDNQPQHAALSVAKGPVMSARLIANAKGGVLSTGGAVVAHRRTNRKRGAPSPYLYLVEIHLKGGDDAVANLDKFANEFVERNTKMGENYQFMIHAPGDNRSGVFWISFAFSSSSALQPDGSLNKQVFTNKDTDLRALLMGSIESMSGVVLQYADDLSNPPS